jgi:hypothetical protein
MLVQLGYDPVVCAPVGGEAAGPCGPDGGVGHRPRPGRDDRRDPGLRPRPPRRRARRARPFVPAGAAPSRGRRALPALPRGGDDLAGLRGDGTRASRRAAAEVYERLGADLAAAEVPVVADLHGPVLDAFCEGGPIRVLKIARATSSRTDGSTRPATDGDDVELPSRRWSTSSSPPGRRRSSSPAGTVRRWPRSGTGSGWSVGPELAVVDPTGSGDSMTAALATAVVAGPRAGRRPAALVGGRCGQRDPPGPRQRRAGADRGARRARGGHVGAVTGSTPGERPEEDRPTRTGTGDDQRGPGSRSTVEVGPTRRERDPACRLLLTNDDGIDAPGLQHLARALGDRSWSPPRRRTSAAPAPASAATTSTTAPACAPRPRRAGGLRVRRDRRARGHGGRARRVRCPVRPRRLGHQRRHEHRHVDRALGDGRGRDHGPDLRHRRLAVSLAEGERWYWETAVEVARGAVALGPLP